MSVTFLVDFTHARKVRPFSVQLGWFGLRIPDVLHDLWVLVVHHPEGDRNLVLLTNVPITYAADAQQVYDHWRHRPEHSGIPIALSKKQAWMWKICTCHSWRPCAASSSSCP